MKNYIYLLVITFVLFSCSKDDDNNNQSQIGSIADIKNWANPEIIDAVENLGFTINEGDNPPNIEGEYQINPRILFATNIEGDWPLGSTFYKINMTFSNQNNTSLTVNFTGYETQTNGTQGSTLTVDNYLENSYIIGSGNLFTVFFKVDEVKDGSPAQLLYAFSGELTEEGISNIQNALFMIDNFGHVPLYIENNTGRIFKDSDSMADRIL